MGQTLRYPMQSPRRDERGRQPSAQRHKGPRWQRVNNCYCTSKIKQEGVRGCLLGVQKGVGREELKDILPLQTKPFITGEAEETEYIGLGESYRKLGPFHRSVNRPGEAASAEIAKVADRCIK